MQDGERAMKRLVACIVACVMVLGVCAGSKTTSAEEPLILIAVPSEGHPGDTIYLSGSGFDPSAKLYITLACPDWYHNPYGNIEVLYGARTDEHGRFLAYRALRAMALIGVRSSLCQVYASDRSNPFAVSAPYAIRAPDEPLSKCARQICVTATAHVAGSHLNMTVHGWPGAKVQVKITYPDGRVQHATTRLDWLGNRLLRVPLAERVTHQALPRFFVKASMDRAQGSVQGRPPSALPAP